MDGRFVPNITIVSNEAPWAVAWALCCLGVLADRPAGLVYPLCSTMQPFKVSCMHATLLSYEPATLSTKAAAVHVSQVPHGASLCI